MRRFVKHALVIGVVFGAAYAALTSRFLAAADEQAVFQADQSLAKALEKADKARESLEGEVLGPLTAVERATFRSLIERVLDGLLQPAETRA